MSAHFPAGANYAAVGVFDFAYKTEVKRQINEFTKDQTNVRPLRQESSDNTTLLTALNAAIGERGLSDYVLPELRH